MQKIVFSPFPGPSLSRVCVEFFQACTNNTARPPSPSSHPSQSVLTSVRQSVSGSRKSESKREEKGGGGGGDELLYYLLLTMGQQAMGQGRRRRKEVAYGRKDGFNAYGHTRSGVIFCTAWIRLLSMAGRIGMLMRSFAEFIFQFRYSKFHLQTIFPRSSEISGFWWRWSSQSPRIPDRCNEISLLWKRRLEMSPSEQDEWEIFWYDIFRFANAFMSEKVETCRIGSIFRRFILFILL